MKCVHCSTAIDRREWFCPNCKRSAPRRHPRAAWTVLPLWVAALAVPAGIWLGLARQTHPAPGDSNLEQPSLVTVLPAPSATVPAELLPTEPAPVRSESAPPAEVPAMQRAILPAPKLAAVPRAVPSPPRGASGTGLLSVVTEPEVETYVYLNGGTLLGQAPLHDTPVPAGRHTLVFWSPAVGGRGVRTIDVEPGRSLLLRERVAPRESFQPEVR